MNFKFLNNIVAAAMLSFSAFASSDIQYPHLQIKRIADSSKETLVENLGNALTIIYPYFDEHRTSIKQKIATPTTVENQRLLMSIGASYPQIHAIVLSHRGATVDHSVVTNLSAYNDIIQKTGNLTFEALTALKTKLETESGDDKLLRAITGLLHSFKNTLSEIKGEIERITNPVSSPIQERTGKSPLLKSSQSISDSPPHTLDDDLQSTPTQSTERSITAPLLESAKTRKEKSHSCWWHLFCCCCCSTEEGTTFESISSFTSSQ